MKNILFIAFSVSVLALTGCATSQAQKRLAHEVRVTVENAILMSEPCEMTCDKIKSIVARFKEEIK